MFGDKMLGIKVSQQILDARLGDMEFFVWEGNLSVCGSCFLGRG